MGLPKITRVGYFSTRVPLSQMIDRSPLTMPEILHDPPTHLILQLGLEEPFSQSLVLMFRLSPDGVRGNCKLRAARCSYLLWNRFAREQYLIYFLVDRIVVQRVGCHWCSGLMRVYAIRRASNRPDTAQVCVSSSEDILRS